VQTRAEEGTYSLVKRKTQAWTFATPDGRLEFIATPGIRVTTSGSGSKVTVSTVLGEYSWGYRTLPSAGLTIELADQRLKAGAMSILAYVNCEPVDQDTITAQIVSAQADKAIDSVSQHFSECMTDMESFFASNGWAPGRRDIHCTDTGFESPDGLFRFGPGRVDSASSSGETVSGGASAGFYRATSDQPFHRLLF
jgi:hypothetical protein